MLKSLEVVVVGGWVAYSILVSAPVPLVLIEFELGLGLEVLGTGLDNYFKK